MAGAGWLAALGLAGAGWLGLGWCWLSGLVQGAGAWLVLAGWLGLGCCWLAGLGLARLGLADK